MRRPPFIPHRWRKKEAPAEEPRTNDLGVDPGVVDRFYTENFDSLVAYLRRKYGAGPPDPEDVAQKAFGRIVARGGLQGVDNPKAFLWRTAVNIFVSDTRTLKAEERRDAAAETIFSSENGYLLTPERVLEAKEQVGIALRVLRQMPEQRRRAFILTRIEGLSHQATAELLGVSRPAVSKHVARATADLHAAFVTR